MRIFNTEGPNVEEDHYCLPSLPLLVEGIADSSLEAARRSQPAGLALAYPARVGSPADGVSLTSGPIFRASAEAVDTRARPSVLLL